MDAAILAWLHAQRTPALDSAFVFSWLLGAFRFCAPWVLLASLWHVARGERREALAWLVAGALVALVPELLKALVARPRPDLVPRLLATSGYSFPSGHAVAGMALYPLLGWLLLRRWRKPWAGYAAGAVLGAFIGVGRLYVGVHWPSDVAAGWALGAAISLGAVRWLQAGASRLDSPAGVL